MISLFRYLRLGMNRICLPAGFLLSLTDLPPDEDEGATPFLMLSLT